MLAQDYKYGKFFRLFNKGNLLCLKNKANQHPPDEQSQGVTVLSAVCPKLPAFTTSPGEHCNGETLGKVLTVWSASVWEG